MNFVPAGHVCDKESRMSHIKFLHSLVYKTLLGAGVLAAALFVAPGSAKADWTLSASLGKGVSVPLQVHPTTIMVAPGYSLLDLVRVEVGLIADYDEERHYKGDIGIRPMVVVDPPLLPIYGRGILGMKNLFNGAEPEYGMMVGVSFGFLLVSVYGEVGILPPTGDEDVTVEARAGAMIDF